MVGCLFVAVGGLLGWDCVWIDCNSNLLSFCFSFFVSAIRVYVLFW